MDVLEKQCYSLDRERTNLSEKCEKIESDYNRISIEHRESEAALEVAKQKNTNLERTLDELRITMTEITEKSGDAESQVMHVRIFSSPKEPLVVLYQ